MFIFLCNLTTVLFMCKIFHICFCFCERICFSENELAESPVRKKLDTKEAGTLHKNKDLKSPKKEIDANRQLTDLIQDAVKRGTPEHNRNIADLSIWDFAGQYVFYATHQIFLSRRAIYLLVTDLSQHLDNPVQDDCYIDSKGRTHCNISEYVTFWLNSIHTFCESEKTGEPPVILVGTFADKLPKEKREEITDEFFTKLRETLAYSEAFEHLSGTTFAIDNSILDPNVEELRKTIVDIATKQSYWTELYPARWVVLERSLENFKRQGKKILPKRTLKLASENLHLPIDNEEFELFLRFHHETGYILYFSDEKLKDHIILEPQWLADALKCFITARQFCTKKADLCKMWLDFNNTAILKRDFIDAVWSRETLFQEHQDLILNFMERLDIIARPRQALNSGNTFEDFYFAPCFLKQTAPDLLLEIDEQECKSTSRLCFTTSSRIISVQLFNKLLAECITKWPISKQNDQYLIFCGCALFSVAKLHELYIYLRDSVIQIWIYKYSKKEPEPDSVVCSNVKDFITDSLNNGIRGSTELEMFVICQESPFKTTENMLKVDDLLREEEYKCNSHERRHVVSTSTLLKCWFPKHFEYQADHSDAFLNRSPTEKELSRLAQRIGREYRSLGFELGLTRPQLDHIEMEERNRTPVDKITAMLSEWVKEKADVATFQELKRAMVAIGIEWNVVFERR
ncbi:roc-COR-CHAT protease-like [Mercenaria mercenaria]|uniref:roc-COR-CHAT protease-like n=1 Tax=Mercenaria mercenaria TaxID=6596 RepID=UPI00234EA3C7|nr:roc-COR-CHAT protease-like [Mercenaria mercenaria]